MKRTGTPDCRDILRLETTQIYCGPWKNPGNIAFVARCVVETGRAKMHLLLAFPRYSLRQTRLNQPLEEIEGYALSTLDQCLVVDQLVAYQL